MTSKHSDKTSHCINVTKSDITSPCNNVKKSMHVLHIDNMINGKKKRGPSKYQYYEANPDVLRLKLKVKKSNIPFSTNNYSVKIKLPTDLFKGNAVQETSRIMAIQPPIWNETLSFLVKKRDFFNKKHYMLDLQLCSTDAKPIDVTVSMDTLCEEDSVIFTTDKPSDHVQNEKDISNIPPKTASRDSNAEDTNGIEVHITGKVDAERDVKFRNINRLCKQEHEFRTKRQRVVFRNMKKKFDHKNLLQVDATPNIAIIGSGGGMRAVIGMCGAMTALEYVGMLDSALYTAGVSGSAWYLMTLYAHDKRLNPKAVNDTIRRKLQPFGTIQFYNAWYNWKYLTKSKAFLTGKYFTITDTFGEMLGDLFLNEKCKQKWSDQRTKLQDGLAPLPLLTALHVRDENKIRDYNEWIELSPYEVFMPRYGAAIDMKNFGDRFYGGFITKEYGEQPIHFLQGMCGSGFTIVRDLKPKESLFYNLVSFYQKAVNVVFNSFDATFVGKVPSWLHGIREFTSLVGNLDENDQIIDSEKEEMMLVDAGISFNSPYPAILHPARKVDVIISFDFSDRGADKNSPFEELSKAEKWAKKRNVPFPELHLDNKKEEYAKEGRYKDVYVFEGENDTPTIVHFVMLNETVFKLCQDCKHDQTPNAQEQSEEAFKRCTKHKDFDLLSTYPTLKFGYTSEEFDQLKSVVEFNVYNNKETLRRCIEDAISRKKFNI